VTGRVVVVGSLNIDVVVTVPRHPEPGETVLATSLQRLPGGKGANQAVAAARAGAAVVMVGCVGDDADGAGYVDRLTGEGIDTDGVRRVAGVPTGTALVVVDETGENTIVVAPGANATVTEDDVRVVDLGPGDVVLLQLEVPLDVVAAGARQAITAGARIVLNVAPFAELPPAVLGAADPVVANEHEAALLGTAPASLVVTRGERGARWVRASATVDVAAPAVDAVDTTGAGDVFAGTLAAALAAGADDTAAMEVAVGAAAAAVTRPGAQ
jgi:ribokinase